MKKITCILLIVFSAIDLFSQINKGGIIFSVDGNYLKTITENGVTSHQNVAQIKKLWIGASVGYLITDRFIAGAGLDYYCNKESRTTSFMINKFALSESMKIKSNAYLPNIYLGYYFPIINNLYINSNFKVSYGQIMDDYNTFYINTENQPIYQILNVDPNDNTLTSREWSSEVDIFHVKLYPELTYFFSSNIGLCLGLGGIEYSMFDWETDNSYWAINFNPVNWRFGIKIKI